MANIPEDAAALDATSPHRQEGDILAISVEEILESNDAEHGAEPSLDRLQLDMLMAIYHELRHGHDQAAAHAAAAVEQAEALRKLTGEVHRLARLLGNR